MRAVNGTKIMTLILPLLKVLRGYTWVAAEASMLTPCTPCNDAKL